MNWISPNFLLTSDLACRLYHDLVAELPIIDYHCHLSPEDLADDRQFENLTELWVASDPYKHRAMRLAGVKEAEITGDADDFTKFRRWAETVPKTLGNPLSVWNALELKRFFDWDEPLTAQNAEALWTQGNAMLASPKFSALNLLRRCKVEAVCSSDRLLDSLSAHRQLDGRDIGFQLLPSLRADDLLALDPEWLLQLTGADLSFDGFCSAVLIHVERFDAAGCRLSDHGLDVVDYESIPLEQTAELYEDFRKGKAVNLKQLRSGILRWVAGEYAKREWMMQLHLGALRQTSSRLRQLAGAAGGYAGIGSGLNVNALARFLDDVQMDGGLPRTVLYNLNPADNALLATLTGSFHNNGMAGTVQFGPAWWYNDHRMGIEAQLETLSAYGLLSGFIGMNTDSRSLLSMTRHEYFRRILCQWLGEQVRLGNMPADEAVLSELVRKLCYQNPKSYLCI